MVHLPGQIPNELSEHFTDYWHDINSANFIRGYLLGSSEESGIKLRLLHTGSKFKTCAFPGAFTLALPSALAPGNLILSVSNNVRERQGP